MIVINNIAAIPILIAIWSADVFLFLTCVRLTLGQLPRLRDAALFRSLQELIDPWPRALDSYLASRRDSPTPTWVSWVILITCLLVVRHLLASFVISAFAA